MKKLQNHANRMKPMDVVKVLMGIRSTREAVLNFQYNDTHWAKLHEYDYEQVLKLAEEVTHQYYSELMCQLDNDVQGEEQNKRRKIQE